MIQIFPLREISQELGVIYQRYLQEGGLPLHILTVKTDDSTPITVNHQPVGFEWNTLLKHFVNDYLNERLKWTNSTEVWKNYLQQILPRIITNDFIKVPIRHYPTDRSYEIRQEAYYRKLKEDIKPWYDTSHKLLEMFETVFDKIRSWINECVDGDGDYGEGDWCIWYYRSVGSDVAIERGIDFRIHDWEMRMQSGEWKHPTAEEEQQAEIKAVIDHEVDLAQAPKVVPIRKPISPYPAPRTDQPPKRFLKSVSTNVTRPHQELP